MKYHYSVKDFVTRLKTNMKKYLIGGLAVVVVAGGASVPALASSGPDKAKGDVGYTAYGLQRNAKFSVEQETNKCTVKWNVTGLYNIAFNLTGDPTLYVHGASLTQTGSSLSGTGNYPAAGPHSYEWLLTSGSVSGSNVTFTAKYTLGADAVTPLTTMTVTGTIAPDGSMSGTWTDNYQGGARTGDWHTTAGAAVPNIIGCWGEGDFKYTDVNGSHYKVQVKYVNVSGSDTWFAGPVTSGNVGAGQWLFAKVHDGGLNDQIWGSFATKDAAKLGVALMSTPTDGPFTITSGNILVH